MGLRALSFAVLVLWGGAAAAQEISIPSVSAPAGASRSISLRFDDGGAAVAGIQFDLTYDPATMDVSVIAGQGARDAAKSVYSFSPVPGLTRFLVVGANANPIPASDLLTLFFQIKSTAKSGDYDVNLERAIAVDPDGGGVALRAVGAKLSISGSPGGGQQITSEGIVNGASFLQGPIAPGEVIVLFGSEIGPAQLQTFHLERPNLIDAFIDGASVSFDGTLAPLLYAQSTQVSAIVPYDVAGKPSVAIRVDYRGKQSNAVTMPVAETAPGLFTADASGAGPGAFYNEDGSRNTRSAPAGKGSVLLLFATGEGRVAPAPGDGIIATAALWTPSAAVTAQIGGVDAEVLYAGAMPGTVAGVIQIRVRVPDSAPSGDAVPVGVSIAGKSSQQRVTAAIR